MKLSHGLAVVIIVMALTNLINWWFNRKNKKKLEEMEKKYLRKKD